MKKRFRSCWSFGNPFSLRFLEGEGGEEGGGDPPVLSVDLDGLKSHKGADGLNFFSDEHLEKLNLWGSDDPTKAKFRTEDGKLDVPKIVKSLLERDKQITKMASPLPEDATESERFEYRKNLSRMLGVPDTPGDYKPIIPEGVDIDQDALNEYLIGAHKHNQSRESVQFAVDTQLKMLAKREEKHQQNLGKQNEESEIKIKAHLGGADKFAANDQLLQRYIHDFTETDEQFDIVFEGIKNTLFSGGEPVKTAIMKALCHAAEQFKGEAKTIYSDAKERITEEQSLKEEFPKSHEDLKD